MRARVQEALALPFAGKGWPQRFLIGAGTTLAIEAMFAGLGYLASGEAGIGIAPVAIAVNFPLLGYALKVFRAALAGEPRGELPAWEGWPELTIRGLAVTLIGLGYSLVPLVMVLAGLNFLVRGGLLFSMAAALIVLGLVAAISVLFFLPMGIARYLAEQRIEAAFRPAALWAAIAAAPGEYVAVYAGAVAAFVVSGVVASVPFAGPLLTPFLAFFFFAVQARLFGEVCGRALHAPARRDVPGAGGPSA